MRERSLPENVFSTAALLLRHLYVDGAAEEAARAGAPCGGSVCLAAAAKQHLIALLLASGDRVVEAANRLLEAVPGAGTRRLGRREAEKLQKTLADYVLGKLGACDALSSLLRVEGVGLPEATTLLYYTDPEENTPITPSHLRGLEILAEHGVLEEKPPSLEEAARDAAEGGCEEAIDKIEELMDEAERFIKPLSGLTASHGWNRSRLLLEAVLRLLGEGKLGYRELAEAVRWAEAAEAVAELASRNLVEY